MIKNCLAIIPARGGSKRIPGKNIRLFHGKPILSYSIRAALACGLFDEVMVSTDDAGIVAAALACAAKVPFARKQETAGDFATLSDVLEEVIDAYAQSGMFFRFVCCILPAAPLIDPKNLGSGFTLLQEKKYSAVFPVIPYTYPIQRALAVRNGRASMFQPEYLNTRSQDLETTYHDAGQFYWLSVEDFQKEKKIFMENCSVLILSPLAAHDIDTFEDWALAELKYKRLFG